MNGDIKNAVAKLNSSKKTKAAMIVINAFNSPLNRTAALNGFYLTRESNVQPLIDFMAGQTLEKLHAKFSWIQALLYQLLVKSDPNQNLEAVI